jgi:hypothetical protein
MAIFAVFIAHLRYYFKSYHHYFQPHSCSGSEPPISPAWSIAGILGASLVILICLVSGRGRIASVAPSPHPSLKGEETLEAYPLKTRINRNKERLHREYKNPPVASIGRCLAGQIEISWRTGYVET